MTKNATEKDHSLKTQLLVSIFDSSPNDVCSEKIQSKDSLRRMEKGISGWEKLTILKTVQKGKNVLYSDHFILGQIIPTANI